MKLRPLHDYLVAELEPIKEFTRGGIIKVAPEPLRIGRVMAIGKGRRYTKLDEDGETFVPTELKVGERIAFFQAVTQTKQGKANCYVLDDNEVLLRETDALFVVPDGFDLEVNL